MIKIFNSFIKIVTLFSLIVPHLSEAEVKTEVYINRTTYLTGEDAKLFYTTFTKNYFSDTITIICDKHTTTCTITTKFSGIGGTEAQNFINTLDLGQRVDFLTADKKFGISCGHTSVKAFCNFYQHQAILLDPPIN